MTPWVEALLGFLLGALLGALISVMFERKRLAEVREELIRTGTLLEEEQRNGSEDATRHTEEVSALQEEIDQRRSAHEELNERLSGLREELAEARTRLEEEKRAAEEISRHRKEEMERLSKEFEALSARALRQNNQSFLDLAKEVLEHERKQALSDMDKGRKAVDQLVEPIARGLEKMNAEIGRIEKARAEAYGGLTEQLRSLSGDQQQLRVETSRLSQALRNPTARGQWGEIQLRRVVEMAGMIDRVDFVEQQSSDTEGGRRRPDLIVHLPGGTEVIVDAKTPMKAYLDSLDAENSEARLALLKTHAQHLKDRIRELSQRSYQDQFDSTPEFTVLFLPSESLFYAALEQDPGLIEIGVEQKILIATPTTLIALLRAVHYGWQQEALAENAQRISVLGRTLYDRICTLGERVEALGKKLNQTVKGYNDMVGTLERRVLPAARTFPELGVGGSKEIPSATPIENSARELQSGEFEASPELP